jgi:transcriptional regulator with XRE-family HTH domain
MVEMVPLMYRLREAMQNKNMKAVELMEKTGVPKSAISVYLSGKSKPKADRLYIIAKALDVSEAWLLGYDVPKFRTDEQKKNDQLAELIVKMRSNNTYFNLVAKLASVDDGRLELIDKLVDGFTNK